MLYGHCYYCRNKARVVFFAPTVALVRQQYQEFRKWFSGQKVDYLVGAETDDKTDVDSGSFQPQSYEAHGLLQ